MASIVEHAAVEEAVASIVQNISTDSGLRARLSNVQFQKRAAALYVEQHFPELNQDQRTATCTELLSKMNIQRLSKKSATTTDTTTDTITDTTTDNHQPTVSVADLAAAAKEAGNVAFAAHDYKAAMVKYNQAISFNYVPLLPTLHTNAAACALAIGDPAQAELCAQACLTLEPNNLKALYRLAMAQQQQNNTQEGLLTLTRATQLDDGLYSDKSTKRLMKTIRKARSELLDTLEEVPIENYSFCDDGKPKVSVYIALEGVGTMASDDIRVEFERISMNLLVRGYNGKNLRLYAAELWSSIDPTKCKVRVKPDMIVLTLKKAQNDGMRPWEKLRR